MNYSFFRAVSNINFNQLVRDIVRVIRDVLAVVNDFFEISVLSRIIDFLNDALGDIQNNPAAPAQP